MTAAAPGRPPGRPRVRLLDYGVGNMHSIQKALERAGLDVDMRPAADGPGDAHATDASERTDGLVLPGVGAFRPAAAALAPARKAIVDAVADGLPLLGVCLGLQLLADSSVEGEGEGLGIVPGRVERLEHPRLPHIGWNTVGAATGANGGGLGPALAALAGRHVYYVHSYALPADTPGVVATTTYGRPFAAIIRKDNVLAAQFHPEKSSGAGRVLLDAFAEMVRARAGLPRPRQAEKDEPEDDHQEDPP